jgi:ribosomal peptide maturation radical SAM protein 1
MGGHDSSFAAEGDVLIVVPPFAALERPALGPHILQACARDAGFRVSILYANLRLAAEMGELKYLALSRMPVRGMMGERFFAASAYGLPPLGRRGEHDDRYFERRSDFCGLPIDETEIRQLEAKAADWVDDLAAAILQHDFKIIGCSTTFHQTAASVALLKRIKCLRPYIVTIIGGANCEGQMAEGIVSLDAGIDFVFSGESEATFVSFLRDALAGHLPSGRIIDGQKCTDLDRLPTPEFAEYYKQFAQCLPDSALLEERAMWLPYESSRGCWWGEKKHCTFCGLNGEAMSFRAKSAGRVLEELRGLLATHPSNRVEMVDNIMPFTYFRDLIPRLNTELPGLHIFYEQKANLSLARVMALKAAGVAVVQPGIEALSSSLLRRIDKGVSAPQNIALLRYGRSVGLPLTWNIMCGIPGDSLAEYRETLAMLPLLRHLHPPALVAPLSIDRFSPYFDDPVKYGLSNVRPWETYASILPEGADATKIAYYFDADYLSESREDPEIISRIENEVSAWRQLWQTDEAPPVLTVTPLTDEQFLLLDTRKVPNTQEIRFLTRKQAVLVLTGARYERTADVEWALARSLIVDLDSQFVPLATAAPQLIQEFEAESRIDRQSSFAATGASPLPVGKANAPV